MKAQEIRSALACGRRGCPCGNDRATVTHCVAHGDDKHPSLSITDGHTAPLVKCFRGCERDQIISALKERSLWAEHDAPRPVGAFPAAEYRYVSADGTLVGVKGRFEELDRETGERSKTFRWRLPGEERWRGLDGAGTETMPLYNLPSVLDDPEKPVFLVEGEKAATALINRGLVAVCLAGGASQRKFGNALDPLKGREVILWPDNDGPGEAFMGRIASFLPDAGFVRPLVPEKGDAYDYFEGGGTLEALDALYQSAQPDVEVLSPTSVAVTLHQPGGDLRFEFSEMVGGPRSLDCVIIITSYLRRTPYRTRLNITSHSARSGIVSELNNVFDFDARSKDNPFKWAALLSEACNLAEEAWKGVDRSVSMADVELVTTREWFVEGLVPKRLVTIPFGMGGGTKSLTFGVYLTLCALYDVPFFGHRVEHAERVLIADYEDTQTEWRLRFHEVAQGLGLTIPEGDWERIRWLPGEGIPLVDQGEVIRRRHQAEPFDLLIVDSAISAVGGDLLDTAAAQRIVNWLTTFGADYDVTSVLLAHNAKGDDPKNKLYPYGNVFWHNLPRSTVFVETSQQAGAKVAYGRLVPRKASRGSISPINYEVTFPERDGEGTLFKASVSEHPSFIDDDSAYGRKWDVASDLLKHGESTAKEVAARLGISEENVRNAFNRNPELFIRRGSRKPFKWAVADDQHVDEGAGF